MSPAFEAARVRPSVPLQRYLQDTERWSPDALHDLQSGLLRRLVRHAYAHTELYHAMFDARGLTPRDVEDIADLRHLPLLDRETAKLSSDARTATAPPTRSNGELADGSAREWREAARARAFSWAGYRPGMRAMHYCATPPSSGWLARRRESLERALGRDLHLSCVVRSEPALAHAAEQVRSFAPEILIADGDGAAALARYINDAGMRRWRDIPVIIVADRLWSYDRRQIAMAFGPVFETYASGEHGLVAAECGQHDAMHIAMEAALVELLVRHADGTVRPAHPGETGEIVVTDLHDMTRPVIRYATGELAIARPEVRCGCGRGLIKMSPVQGSVPESMRRHHHGAVGGKPYAVEDAAHARA